MSFTLKEDQIKSVEAARASIKRGFRSILLQGATGSGKSVMASYILKSARDRGNSFWFTVPRRDLIRQMAETFREFDLPFSYIAANMPYNPYAQGHIVSVQTVMKRIKEFEAGQSKIIINPPKVAFIDETHFGGKELDDLIAWLKLHGTLIIGGSATPWKMSGQGLNCWYDDMILGPSIDWLIQNNRLSKYRAFGPSSPDLSQIKTIGGDYNQGQLGQRMEGDHELIGKSALHYKKHAYGKLGVTFGVTRVHSQKLAQAYKDNGISAAHVDGDTPDDQKRQIFVAFAKREILQLCCAELLTFGFDLSSASGIKGVCVQMLSDCQPTKSIAKQMQKWGRALRFEGIEAEPHLFFDHANNFQEHGLPCDDREWTLADRDKTSGGLKSIPVRLCPKCYLSHHPSPRCPACGHEYPKEDRILTESSEELAEIKAANQIKILEAKKLARMEVGQAKTLEDLRRIQQERGYHPKWIQTQARIKDIKE